METPRTTTGPIPEPTQAEMDALYQRNQEAMARAARDEQARWEAERDAAEKRDEDRMMRVMDRLMAPIREELAHSAALQERQVSAIERLIAILERDGAAPSPVPTPGRPPGRRVR